MPRNSKAFTAALNSIKRNDAAIKGAIQTALIECAMFIFEDRNADPAIRLFKAVSNGVNKRAMSHWMSANAAVYFKDGAPLLSSERQKELANTMTCEQYMAELNAAPAWFEHNTEANKPANIWDGAAQLETLRKHLTKLETKAKENGDTIFAELVGKLTAGINADAYDAVEVN